MSSSPVLATDLGALEAAARLGSFTRAAEELGMSQPAISQQVKRLERRLRTALVVRRGDGYWPGQECWKLAEEIIYPVCSPRYLATRAPITEPADLTRHRLIHVHDNIFRHVVWTDWFKAMNVPESEMSTGFEFND